MKIGILEAETLPPSITEKFGGYAGMFERLLGTVDPTLSFQLYAVDKLQLPGSIDDCDAYLLTGSRFSAYDHKPWITELQAFIREINQHKKKCIGICFGHQLIAHTLGGLTQRSEKGWGIGAATSMVQHRPQWMEPNLQRFTLLVSHQDQVQSLPEDAVLIAGNDFCPIAAYQISNHMLCFQGHPEFSREYARHLMEKRRAVIGEQRVDKALSSLRAQTDEQSIAAGILAFLKS